MVKLFGRRRAREQAEAEAQARAELELQDARLADYIESVDAETLARDMDALDRERRELLAKRVVEQADDTAVVATAVMRGGESLRVDFDRRDPEWVVEFIGRLPEGEPIHTSHIYPAVKSLAVRPELEIPEIGDLVDRLSGERSRRPDAVREVSGREDITPSSLKDFLDSMSEEERNLAEVGAAEVLAGRTDLTVGSLEVFFEVGILHSRGPAIGALLDRRDVRIAEVVRFIHAEEDEGARELHILGAVEKCYRKERFEDAIALIESMPFERRGPLREQAAERLVSSGRGSIDSAGKRRRVERTLTPESDLTRLIDRVGHRSSRARA